MVLYIFSLLDIFDISYVIVKNNVNYVFVGNILVGSLLTNKKCLTQSQSVTTTCSISVDVNHMKSLNISRYGICILLLMRVIVTEFMVHLTTKFFVSNIIV